MYWDVNHRGIVAKPETLGGDFALILGAFVDAFRGLTPPASTDGETIHYAGWR